MSVSDKIKLHAIQHNNMMWQQWASKAAKETDSKRKKLCERMAFAYKEIRDVITEYGEVI